MGNKPIILQFIWYKKIPYILTWSQGYFWPWYYYHFWGYSCYKCPFSTRLSFSHPWSDGNLSCRGGNLAFGVFMVVFGHFGLKWGASSATWASYVGAHGPE